MALTPIQAPITSKSRGVAVANLQDALLFLVAQGGLTLEKATLAGLRTERRLGEFGSSTAAASTAALKRELPNGIDDNAASGLNKLIDKYGGFGSDDGPKLKISGVLLFPDGRPAVRKQLQLVQAPIGADEYQVLPATTAPTDSAGRYTINLDMESERTQVLAVAVRLASGPLLTKIIPKIGAIALELNLVMPVGQGDAPLAEAARLKAAVESQATTWPALASAREDEARRDISRLADATGWPAGAMALAAMAANLAKDGSGGEGWLQTAYGLLRTGMPGDAQQLAAASKSEVSAALEDAKAANVLPSDFDVASGVALFEKFRATQRLNVRLAGTSGTSLGSFIDSLPGAPVSEFKPFLAGYEGSREGFWAQAATQMRPADVERLEKHFALGEVTTFNTALPSKLSPTKPPASPEDMIELGFYGAAELEKQFVAGLTDPQIEAMVPPAYAGSTPRERAALYASDMAYKLRAALPTHVVSHQLRTDKLGPVAQAPAVGKALQRALALPAPAKGVRFTLGTSPMGRLLREHGAAVLADVQPKDRPTVVAELHRVQRVYQLSPRNATAPKLLAAGLDSAARIAAMSPAQARQALGAAGLEKEEAELVLRKAHQVRAGTHALMTTARMAVAAPGTQVIARLADTGNAAEIVNAVAGSPTLESLLGSLDYCECEHCDSVLSPSAYFVDLLRMLEAQLAGSNGSAYEQLVKRRPDLPHLPLTCDNTHTLLPHIDLVNETLEFLVAHDAAYPLDQLPPVDNAGTSSDDLIAEPRTVRVDAYTRLADPQLRYPPALPFDLAIETARAWSPRLGGNLFALLDVTRTADALDAPAGGFGRRAVDLERLGISPVELDALTPTTSSEWFKLFGFATSADAVDPVKGLGSVKAVVESLGLTYVELFAVLGTRFVNPSLANEHRFRLTGLDPAQLKFWLVPANQALLQAHGAISGGPDATWSQAQTGEWNALAAEQQATLLAMGKIGGHLSYFNLVDRQAFEDDARTGKWDAALIVARASGAQAGGDDCDMSAHLLRHADGQALADIDWLRLALFVRWWRRLAWSVGELDMALHAFMPVIVTQAGEGLTDANLASRWLATFVTHLGAFADVHTRLEESLSREELLCFWSDIPVHGPQSLYARLFLAASVLQADPAFDSPTGQYLKNSTLVLEAHAPVVAGALELKRSDLALVAPGGVLNIATLSALYRHALLARALKLSVAELLELRAIHIDGALFEPVGTTPRPLPDSGDTPVRLALRLVDAMAQMGASEASLADVAAWRTNAPGSKDHWRVLQHVGLDAPARAAWLAALATEVAADASAVEALWARFGGPSLESLKRRPWVAALDGTKSTLTGSIQVVAQGRYKVRIASSIANGAEATANLAGRKVVLADGATSNEIEIELAPSVDHTGVLELADVAKSRPLTLSIELPAPFGWVPLEQLSIEGFAAGVDLRKAADTQAALLRAARVCATFGLTGADLAYLASPAGALSLEAIANANGDAPSNPRNSRSAWRIFDYIDLHREFPQRVQALRSLLHPTTPTDQRDTRMADLAQRPVADVEQARIALGQPSADALAEHTFVRRVWRLLGVCHQAAMSVATVVSLRQLTDTAANTFSQRLAAAHGMREGERARVRKSTWKAVSQPIADRLRRASRNALVQYLLHVKPLLPTEMTRTADNLYQWLLIDPGMQPVVQTSRLRLAIGAVQLYIQRVLLGLENADPVPLAQRVPATAIDSERWEWMKRYRVWEANRKVFLYPENWLEPEFRDDRTHLFRELEGTLLQGELTEDSAEEALLRYMDGLVEIANLDIVATFLDVSDAPVAEQALHVLGRTRNDAPKFFYRQRQRGMWTAWEPVTASVSGDHIAPVVWKGRVFLVWVNFEEQAPPPNPAAYGNQNPAAQMSMGEIGQALLGAEPVKTLKLRLNWAERRRDGSWTEQRSGDLMGWPRAESPTRGPLDPPIAMQPSGRQPQIALRRRDQELPPPEDDGNNTDGEVVDTTDTSPNPGGGTQTTPAARHDVSLFPADFPTRNVSMRCQVVDTGELSVTLSLEADSFESAFRALPSAAQPLAWFSLRLAGRHAKPLPVRPPVAKTWLQTPTHLYSSHRARATWHQPTGSGLEVTYTEERTVVGGTATRKTTLYDVLSAATSGSLTLPVNRPPLHAVRSDSEGSSLRAEFGAARRELYSLALPLFFQNSGQTVLALPEGGDLATSKVPATRPTIPEKGLAIAPVFPIARDARGHVPQISPLAAFKLEAKMDAVFTGRKVIRFGDFDLPSKALAGAQPAVRGATR